MFGKNLKILTLLLSLATLLYSQDFTLRKTSEGTYSAEFEKKFTIGEKLDVSLRDYEGDIIIRGSESNELVIRENATFRSYSEQDAKQKYHRNKIGFILNNDKLELSGNRFHDKNNNALHLQLPNFAKILLQSTGSDIIISETDGDLVINASDGNLEMVQVSSRTKIEGSSLDIKMIDCQVMGDITLSRGMLTITGLTSEYLNASLFGADLEADNINSRVTFKTTGSDINIDNSDNDAKLYASGGDITVGRIRGNIYCETKGGTIELGYVTGMCKIDCISGDLFIDEVLNNLNITAINSDIEIEKAAGSVAIDNSNGDIEIYKALQEDVFSVMIKNRHGDIDLYLDSDVRAEINARIGFKSRDAEEFEIESDFELDNMKFEKNGKNGYISRHGVVNGGGATIILKNDNGDIYIYKE